MLVPGFLILIWCLVLGAQPGAPNSDLVLGAGPWTPKFWFGTWFLVLGARLLILIWYLVLGVGPQGPNFDSVLGSWYRILCTTFEFNAWFLVLGPAHQILI